MRPFNSELEIPFLTEEIARIVYRSIEVDESLNSQRSRKTLQVKGRTIRVKVSATDARALRSSTVGIIDSIVLVCETVERFDSDK